MHQTRCELADICAINDVGVAGYGASGLEPHREHLLKPTAWYLAASVVLSADFLPSSIPHLAEAAGCSPRPVKPRPPAPSRLPLRVN